VPFQRRAAIIASPKIKFPVTLTATVLAKQSDVSLYTVRHYTRIGLLKPVRNSQNNYKIYQPSDAIRVRFIKAVGNLGFSLSEIAEIWTKLNMETRPARWLEKSSSGELNKISAK
jgi:DNA-binding transcriptional MerR regulator